MQTKRTIKPKVTYLLVLIMLVFTSPIQGLNLLGQRSSPDSSGNLSDYTIQFSSRELSLKKALDELFQHKEFNIVYGGKEIDVDVPIVFTSRTLKLSEALKQIEQQAPVEFIIDNKHIVVKSRETDKSDQSTQNFNNVFTVSGFIATEQNEKLPGVNVYLKGTTIGTVTNEDGFYTLKVREGNNSIVFSFIGYQTQERTIYTHRVTQSHPVSGDKTLNIVLEPNEEMLEEICITSQRKFFGNMDYGRELPSIDSKVIAKLNSSNASDIIHARVAGVWATKTSGAPGDQQKIRVRGQTSFFSSAEPLYVIDGVPVPIVNLASLGIADLNMNDIDNVTVLKDASSTALYGYQGGNGVILIDTKQSSDSKINFSYKTGIQWFNNYYDLMDNKEFLGSLQLAKQNINSNLYLYYPPYSDTLCDHNRQNEIFSKGIVNEYQLSGGGNAKELRYYWSGNYTGQTGILSGSAYQRATFTTRLSKTFGKKLALSASYRGSYQNNENNQNTYSGNRQIFEGINKSPCLECTPDSLIYRTERNNISYYKRIHYGYGPLNSSESLQSLIDNNNIGLIVKNHALSLFAKYSVTKELSVNVMESAMMRSSTFSSNAQYYSDQSLTSQKSLILFKSNEDVRLLNHQVNVSYNKMLGLNEISIVLANRYYTDNLWWTVDTLGRELPEHYTIRNSMAGYGMQGSVIRKMNTYLANFSYNYRNTYYLSAMANASWLKEGVFTNNFDLFPSVSVSWNMANEPFMGGTKWLNELRLYSNFGVSGNYPLSGLANDIYTYGDYSEGGEGIGSYPYIEQFANHHLKHESTKEVDFGFKFSALNKRIRLNGVLYKKQIGNQIIQRNIPDYYGGGNIFFNLGEIAAKGYEMELEAIPVSTANFNWHLLVNFSSSKQKVTELADDEDILFYTEDKLFPEFVVKENEPLGNIYGYKYLGTWKEEYRNDNSYAKVNNAAFYNSDTTDTRITENDKVVIGNSIPDFTWNLNSSFRYKNFTLDVSVYSVWGVDKYNATRAATMMTGLNRDVLALYNDSISILGKAEFYESDLFIDDASFIRLKSLTFGYEPPQKIMGIKWAFSVSFENLLTITNYRGYDPEATIYTDNNFSDNAIDKGAYPSPKSVFFKINLRL